MSEKDCCNSFIRCKLDSVPKAFFIELGCERMNCALAFVNISIYFCNPVINVLLCRQRTILLYKGLDLLRCETYVRKTYKLGSISGELSMN